MTISRLTPDGYRRVPWRNGHGVSHEVARTDGDTGAQWLVSLTTIARDCPFSDYRGYDRALTPLRGGVILAVDDAAPARLEALRPFAFAGDATVGCRLAEGPAEVINAMVARSWGSQEVRLLRGPVPRLAVAAPAVVLYAIDPATVTIDGATFPLGAGAGLRIDAMAGSAAAIAAAPAAHLYVAAFRPHG